MRPLFQLDARLQMCADFVPPGAVLADIGTDHAYLPVWLCKSGKIPKAIAADIGQGPLQSAGESIARYQAQDRIETRLSDGLAAFSPGEADTIVIAGMGGELIARILSLIRRYTRFNQAEDAAQPLVFDGLKIDLDTRSITTVKGTFAHK